MFALLMLFLCVIVHNMWSGKSLQLFWYVVVTISMMFVKIMLAVCMLVGMMV